MIERADRKRILHRAAAGFLVLAIPMAGFVFGSAAGEDPAGSGQIQPGTSLAAKIEKKALVQVITPAGTTEIRHPLIVPGGITSQGAATPIPWSEVRKIRFQGRATMTGMWIGAGLGAALGIGGQRCRRPGRFGFLLVGLSAVHRRVERLGSRAPVP